MFQARLFTASLSALAATLAIFLAAPIVTMVAQETPARLIDVLADAEARAAIGVSMGGGALATATLLERI